MDVAAGARKEVDMSRQNTILIVVAVVVLVAIGAFVYWPKDVEKQAPMNPPAATTESSGATGGTSSDGTAGTDSGTGSQGSSY